MVGNAEPGKEYNYRPLSKLCECQLDVNDQVSTKGPGEGGLGEEKRLNSNRKQETDRRKRETGGSILTGARKRFKALAVGPVLHVPRFSG